MNKPREFWVNDNAEGDGTFTVSQSPWFGYVHVIDYTAYTDALKMLEEMAADLDYYSKHNHLLKTTAPNFAAETLDKYRKFKEGL